MLRLSKLTDYGTVIMTALARHPRQQRTAAELADATHVAVPTVSKILKTLAHEKLLVSNRGAYGGYKLARAPENISMADIISALEGPIALTECAEIQGHCSIQPSCLIGANWQRINAAIRGALEGISLADMIAPLPLPVGRKPLNTAHATSN
jgi:FeS assembly SUF system regulator